MRAFNKTVYRAARLVCCVVTLVLFVVPVQPARALDVDAGDYTGAIPSGTNLALLYYQHAGRSRLYAQGHKVSDGNIISDIGIARYARFIKVAGFLMDPQILIPFGNLRGRDSLDALGSHSGLGDIILASTVWLLNNPARKTYLGVTPFLYVPVGTYNRNDGLNLGEHRWKFTLQAGFITPIVAKLSFDLIGDVTVFGHNSDYGSTSATLKQDPLFQLQSWLRYHVLPTLDFRAGGSYLFGGKTSVDDADQADRTSTGKFLVGAAWFALPTLQFIGTVGRDITVRQGPMETARVNLRVLKIF